MEGNQPDEIYELRITNYELRLNILDGFANKEY